MPIGTSSATKEKLAELIDAGADAFRINFSHGTYEEHKERIKTIRKLEKEKGKVIAILADMQGPKLRVGNFKEEKVWLEDGQIFTLDMKSELGDNTRVCLPHKEIFAAIKVGDKLLVNDGYIVLEVVKVSKTSMDTVVKVGGYISSHKGVNLPNTKLKISAISLTNRSEKMPRSPPKASPRTSPMPLQNSPLPSSTFAFSCFAIFIISLYKPYNSGAETLPLKAINSFSFESFLFSPSRSST